MSEGKYVTFFPSYGTEVRGGTAVYHLIISSEEIFSPPHRDSRHPYRDERAFLSEI